jgi:hypothetical protein
MFTDEQLISLQLFPDVLVFIIIRRGGTGMT